MLVCQKIAFLLLKNIDFINLLIKEGVGVEKIIIVDSDSNDGTKEYCKSLKNDNILFIEEDNVKNNFHNRIEILSHCRNIGLQNIEKTNDVLYIPIDLDIDLFSLIKPKSFIDLVKNFQNNKDIDALFPYSEPYYYDIFALRKQGWVDNNAVLQAHKLKQKFKIGSFFFNYFLVFKKQISKNKFSEDLIRVESAFGGIGLYKINKNKIIYMRLKILIQNFILNTCLSIIILKIYLSTKTGLFQHRKMHINFHLLRKLAKVVYIVKTFKYDILDFLTRENMNTSKKLTSFNFARKSNFVFRNSHSRTI